MIIGIDHVGIAVRDGGSAAAAFARLTGWAPGDLETVAAQQVRLCFLPAAPGDAPAGARLELLVPGSAESAVGRFLERRGEGMHHVCFAVEDIEAELARLAAEGFELIDAVPRRGHGGLVAFVHPRAANGVLIELLQRDPPHQAGGA